MTNPLDVSKSEQAASIKSINADLDKFMPSMFRDRVTLEMVAFVSFNALKAAAKARVDEAAALAAAIPKVTAAPVVPQEHLDALTVTKAQKS
jgi:hypothetical protein